MNKTNTFYKEILRGIRYRSKKILKSEYSKVNMNWFYVKYLKHLPPNRIHSHKLFGHKTFFYGGREYLHGIHEIFIEEVYGQKLPENANILDCGAHIGLSVIYLKKICPNANIIAFEPDEHNYELLQKNIQSHHLKNITIKKEAVWIANMELNFIQNSSMGSKIELNENSHDTKVKAVRLKDLLNKKIDFLKMDIEGAEYAVLKDIENELHFVSKMFIEYHGTFDENNELIEILKIIEVSNFRFYIKEAAVIFESPFMAKSEKTHYDVQLNIFCFKSS